MSIALWPLLLVLNAAVVHRPDGEVEALRVFRAAFRTTEDPRALHDARTQALRRLAAFDSERVVQALLGAYEVLEAEASPIFAGRAKPLRDGGGLHLAPSRRELYAIYDLQEGILAQLRAVKSEAALEEMVTALTRRRRDLPVVPRAVLAARAVDLAAKGAQNLVQSTSRAKSDEDVALLLQALRALEKRAQDAGPWVVKQLDHRSPMIRELAAHTLGAIAWPGSLERLVACVEQTKDGPLQVAAARSLEVLTRQKLGLAGASWRAWFRAEGARFVDGTERLGGGTPSDPKASRAGYYFGIPQTGESILYLYDNSNSMKNRLGSRSRKGQAQGPTRIEKSREELKQALSALGAGRRFNIVAFANRLRVLSETPLEATPENVARAHQWLDDLGLELHTNTYDALELGFVLAGRGTFDRYYEPVYDTMFVLSDGAPTIPNEGRKGLGPDKPPERILAAVRRWNAFGRVTVHTIGLGAGKGNQFMRQLAQQNGGRFENVN
ncbi:MAG: HEAT repeat domain-containing protein [Planctomycetes bacterium]|nr:HEAT repeat domain-containing protein [Planctomycetota bacterium]